MARRTILCLTAVLLAASGLLVQAQASPAGPAAAPTSGPYVALGDSYAAGPLIPSQRDPVCLRSDHNYPSLVAAALSVAAFQDVSCSGATTDDMTHSQHPLLGSAPPQFGALGTATRLVTLTIGGNDIGFTNVLVTCGLLSLANPFGAPCRDHYTAGGSDSLAASVQASAPKVAAVLQGIRQRSPQARIVVVGYLDILPASGAGCWPVVPVASGDVAYLNGIELQLNQMLANQAASHGASFVDTYTPSIGHDACSPIGVKWVEGLVPTSPAYPVHPNALGMHGAAAAVLSALA